MGGFRVQVPVNFKYREAYERGRPRHGRTDEFSLRHPRMDVGRRAKIFAPFAALRGFEGEIASQEVRYVPRQDLSAEDARALDRTLAALREACADSRRVRAHPVTVRVTFFVPCSDPHHGAFGSLGRYESVTGVCRGVDPDVERTIRVDGTALSLADVAQITVLSGTENLA